MPTTLITVDFKLFQMMLYIIIPKVRTFHQPTANRFSTARKKPAQGNSTSPAKMFAVSRFRICLDFPLRSLPSLLFSEFDRLKIIKYILCINNNIESGEKLDNSTTRKTLLYRLFSLHPELIL